MRCAAASLLVPPHVSASLIRIFSDLHFGDRASMLMSLESLLPLCDGATRIVLNGDTLDTRPSPDGSLENATALRSEVLRFFERCTPPAILLTGNHDPDISSEHHLDLGARLFVIHGDAFFDDVVPWSRDAGLAGKLVARELAALPSAEREELVPRLGAFRRAVAAIPQRHHAETHGLSYLIGFARDTVWPPSRILRVLRAWRQTAGRAEAFARHHRPRARFVAMGHTHRLGAQRTAQGLVVLNTGSFCPPCRAGVIDVTDHGVKLRRIERRAGEYRLGSALAEFPLAPGEAVETLRV